MPPITSRIGQVDQAQRQTSVLPHLNLSREKLDGLIADVRSLLSRSSNGGVYIRRLSTETPAAAQTPAITRTTINLHPDIEATPATYQPAFSLAPGATDLEALATLAPQFRPLAAQLVKERAALKNGGTA
ncbi:hypothetical protein A3K48_04520 [candidate division WOR-1 bacterium RIFOXYA12_FULL_52_29]|uniref:Uncharacterized protein n=1 Tax=candidate division WOR-1 bacterium RIFOXYC12_FULL_54_18 TaxID=1802584 RepID=A0A1F4T6N7_UNCSA|nr:MAG: hypothetical protein A3K44_04520 [candidate division WOR-1 bacterium RIFOXYA2_FULL_51_19]OGC17813.1 MAG: hypothetical protein A3K48_04520 [candidate division WOR-1 bacterium RIFOXYA12_FULL_52_29]OGC26670.1 MAG: hypothetical protein A3K32_04515 [candidate division WOR-1 bacterium RIFOXYB2_FULL_45_9]OGC28230.1 MAG: hypothetical protein A3K49_04520 [candidate division WOR-1 bacterium RIFOXYC12_FULL_54_18]OGC29482.1 MAG: hypothetical protein A2346_01815 [candidate division WOR-1 bacterium R